MDDVYPLGPEQINKDLTKPSSTYKSHAWLAVLGLVVFITLYLALTGWFAWTAYRLFELGASGARGGLFVWIVAGSSAFLALFMIKALFFVKHGGEINDIEVTPEEEPALFKFLYRLADDAGAPRPHKVYLSPRVNAAVFYDLSPLNLILPSKKNLEIGLGLVNVLTLSEFKAVLAHEFGHFAQRSMAVGSWVYIAQQIAAHIIAKRDALDKFLGFISRIDLRIAWVGWILTLVVWSLRAVLETAFSLVLMAQRALSREMEFQADLVAASLTGSDALVHALYKLQTADDAWDRAQGFVGNELQKGSAVQDIFALQLRVLENVGNVLDEPDYGKVPPLPDTDRESYRLFETEIAQPPRMWATHPFNHEREESIKRQYIPAPLDDRSAWTVFKDAAALRRRVSNHLQARFEATEKNLEDSLNVLDQQYKQQYLKNVYRGAYLGRSIVRHAKTPKELYHADSVKVAEALFSLYPDSITDDLKQLRNYQKEVSLLQALRDGTYQAPDGVIRHRGREVTKKELPGIIADVRAEMDAILQRVLQHDKQCRSVHIAAGRELGRGWDSYLEGLVALLHYADHCEANLRDVQGFVNNVVAVITADRRVTSGELKRLLKATDSLYTVLAGIFQQAGDVSLDSRLCEKLGAKNWPEALGELQLPPPTRDNINDWMNAVDSWIGAAAGALSALYSTALEELLTTETQVAMWHRKNAEPEAAPAPSRAPDQYPTLTPGQERALQKKLGLWDRFQTADGFVPGLFRFLVSAGIVGTAVFLGATIETLF